MAVLGATTGALLLAAGAASAHADLVSSTPPDGAVLAAEPGRLTLTYSEAVTLRLSSISVVAPDGRHVAAAADLGYGAAGQDSLSILLATDKSQGTYVVDWQATAADDGHATSGFVTFSVGVRSRFTAPIQVGARDELTDAAMDVAEWLGFAGLALLVGDAVVRRLARPGSAAAPRSALRRTLPTALLGWTILLIATLAQLLLAGPLARGESPAHAFDSSLLSATLSAHEGRALMVRLVILAAVAVFGEMIRASAGGRTFAALFTVMTLALAATWSATSHAASGSQVPFALVVTTVHVAAMAVWVGGLATMALLFRHARAAGADDGAAVAGEGGVEGGVDLAAVSARFSRLALSAVTALVASGLYQAWREAGGVSALTGTDYGRLLLVKVAVVLAVLAAAARSRSLVARRRDRSSDHSLNGLRTSVRLELLGVAVVLVVTVLLIGNAPAR